MATQGYTAGESDTKIHRSILYQMKGEASAQSDPYIGQEYLTKISGMVKNLSGIQARKTFSSKGTSTSLGGNVYAIHGMDYSNASVGVSYFIAIDVSKNVRQISLSASSFTVLTGALSSTSSVDTADGTVLNNLAIFTYAGSTPLTWDGVAAGTSALGGSPPLAYWTTTLQGYCFMARTSVNASRVFWSAVGDPATWPAANFVDVSIDDGDILTAIKPYNNQLYIFKRNKTYKFVWSVTPSDGSIILVANNIGMVNPQSCDFYEGKMYFISGKVLGTVNTQLKGREVYVYDGSSFTSLSNGIESGDKNTSSIYMTVGQNTSLTIHPGQRMLYTWGQDSAYALDLNTLSWSNPFANIANGAGAAGITGGIKYSSVRDTVFVGQDNASPFSLFYELQNTFGANDTATLSGSFTLTSKRYEMDGSAATKDQLVGYAIYANSPTQQNVTLNIYNESGTNVYTATVTLPAGLNVIYNSVSTAASAYAYAWELTGTISNNNLQFFEVDLMYKSMGVWGT